MDIKYDYIKQGDCLDLMGRVSDKSVDMILCDLPYGTTACKWDKKIDLNRLWEEYNRIIKDNGAILLFSQVPFSQVLGSSNIKNLRYEWIWEKPNATGFLRAKKAPLKKHENILVFYKKTPTYNPQFTKGKPYKITTASKSPLYGDFKIVETNNDGYRYPVDIQAFSSDRGLHPTQKPITLLEYLIKTYTNEGEVVLDNCMGSGSTCVACINTNRRYIGFELEENYFDIAKKRIEEAKAKKGETK